MVKLLASLFLAAALAPAALAAPLELVCHADAQRHTLLLDGDAATGYRMTGEGVDVTFRQVSLGVHTLASRSVESESAVPGQEHVKADAPSGRIFDVRVHRLEIRFPRGSQWRTSIAYAGEDGEMWAMQQLDHCWFSREDVVQFFGFKLVDAATVAAGVDAVGFDIDDTLLFSTPAFDYAARLGLAFGSRPFWETVNGAGAGRSLIKERVLEVVKDHQRRGHRVYAITARPSFNGAPLQSLVAELFGIAASDVYFEPSSKVERIRALGIDVFYGDSDSDVTDAMAAGAMPVRVLRSHLSSYRDAEGNLAKYQPGRFGEEILTDSYGLQ